MFSKNTYANEDLSTSPVVRIQAKSLRPYRCLLPIYSGMGEAHYFFGNDDEPIARTFFIDKTLVVLTTIKSIILCADEITCGSIRIKYLENLFVEDAYDESIPCSDLSIALRGRYHLTQEVKINCNKLLLEENTSDVTFTENKMDVGVSGARATSQQTTYVPVHLHVGELHLDVNTATFTNVQGHCNTVTGHVDTLILQSIPDSFQSESSHFAASTTGVVNFGRGTTESLSLPNPCHLHVVNDVDGAFTVGVAHITGAKITSGGVSNLNAEKIISKPVTTYTKSSSKGLGVSLNQSTFNLGKNKSHRIDKQDNVIYGKKGTKIKSTVEGDLHTASADGGQMLVEEKSRKRAINVPLPTHTNQKRFKHAFEVLKSPDFFIPQKQAADWQSLHKHYPEETEQSISEKIKLAHFFSQQAYEKDCGEHAAADKGYQLIGKYKDSRTDSTIAVYINPHNQQGVIAFAGSVKKAWFTDDIDIFSGKPLRSMTKTPVIDFINTQIQLHHETSFTLTGHSRGASQASIASDLFGTPAIVFDNPGVISKQGYTFSKVISFQSTPNIVNAIDDITARSYSYGTEIRLQANASEQMLNAGATLIGNALQQPLVSGLLFGGQTFFSHTNKQIGAKLDDFLDETGEMDVILTQ